VIGWRAGVQSCDWLADCRCSRAWLACRQSKTIILRENAGIIRVEGRKGRREEAKNGGKEEGKRKKEEIREDGLTGGIVTSHLLLGM